METEEVKKNELQFRLINNVKLKNSTQTEPGFWWGPLLWPTLRLNDISVNYNSNKTSKHKRDCFTVCMLRLK